MIATEDSYSIFVVDPPWPKKKGGSRSVRPNQSQRLDYATMSVEEIFSLLDNEVLKLASLTHTVFIWGVDQFLHDGEKAMADRGYKMHARFIWDKGNGVAPAFSVRYSHEYVTWWYKPRFMPVEKSLRGKYTTVIREPSRQHSRKPDAFYEMVGSMFPSERKIDVFSREKRDGWDQWGNEIDMFTSQ